MTWNREIDWSGKAQTTTAILLWVSLGLIVFSPVAYRRLQKHPRWRHAVVSGKWAPQSMRRDILIRLFESPEQEDVPLLIELIDRDSDHQRLRWVMALQRLPGKAANDAISKLAKDSDSNVRAAALYHLSRNGDASAIPIFYEILSSPNPEINNGAAAVQGLGRLNEKAAIAPMLNVLRNFSAPDVLTDFEIILGRTAAQLAGQQIDFSERCHRGDFHESLDYLKWKMESDKFPDRASELASKMISYNIGRKRKFCDGRNVVAARAELLRWWEKQHAN